MRNTKNKHFLIFKVSISSIIQKEKTMNINNEQKIDLIIALIYLAIAIINHL